MAHRAKSTHKTKTLQNRKARFEFEVEHTLRAGIVLTGAEVRSIRNGHVALEGSFVSLKQGEAWLINAHVTPVHANRQQLPEPAQRRDRKLLLTTKELTELASAKDRSRTAVPLQIISGKFIKLEIGIGRRRKKQDKRALLRQRDTERELRRSFAS